MKSVIKSKPGQDDQAAAKNQLQEVRSTNMYGIRSQKQWRADGEPKNVRELSLTGREKLAIYQAGFNFIVIAGLGISRIDDCIDVIAVNWAANTSLSGISVGIVVRANRRTNRYARLPFFI